MDSVRGRCLRSPCRYYHAPASLTGITTTSNTDVSDTSPVGPSPSKLPVCNKQTTTDPKSMRCRPKKVCMPSVHAFCLPLAWAADAFMEVAGPRLLGFKVGSSTSLLLQTVGVLLNKSNITAIKPLSGETRGRDRTRDSLERGAIKILHNLRLLQQHYFVEKLSMVYFNSVDASWTLLQTRNLINVLFFSFILSPCLPWAVSATVWPTMLPAMRFMLCLPH